MAAIEVGKDCDVLLRQIFSIDAMKINAICVVLIILFGCNQSKESSVEIDNVIWNISDSITTVTTDATQLMIENVEALT